MEGNAREGVDERGLKKQAGSDKQRRAGNKSVIFQGHIP